ncbi:MAG: hypothetical protein ACRBCJ_00655 [Hyphomicrobiaceae bacterium]
MSLRLMVWCLPLVLLCSGCATIVEGTDQVVAIKSNPDGAKCDLRRDGQALATVEKTPEHVTVSKSKNDIHVTCNKDGIGETTAVLRSSINPMVGGNLLIGGVIGGAVDAASGAMNEYPKEFNVVFPRDSGTTPASRPKPEGPPVS